MTTSNTTKTTDASLARGWLHVVCYYLSTRWALLAIGALVLMIGASLNWGWLLAAGMAPILIALAPCAVMCALGLCAMKMMGGSK